MLLQTPVAPRVSRVIFGSNDSLHAPHLIDVEVAQVLRRYVRSAAISPERGAEALADLGEFPIHRHPHVILLPRIWQMRDQLTAYDAAYVALAEALDAHLITRDRALAQAAIGARVQLI